MVRRIAPFLIIARSAVPRRSADGTRAKIATFSIFHSPFSIIRILCHTISNADLGKQILRFGRIFFDLAADICHIDA